MAKRNLLLVDADPRSVRVLEVSLRKAGYSVTTSSSVDDALELVELTEPDMVVSDTQLSGRDGFAFIEAVRSNPQLSKIPFVFLSSDSSVESKVRGLELGANEYLTKPVYIREILTRIHLIFQRQDQEGALRTSKTRFAGSLADMGLVDLLQTIDVSRKSGVLHLTSGQRHGAVYFADGRLLDAELGQLSGEPAIYRFLVWSEGEFEVDFREVRREDRIQVSTQGILMEGMRRLDEWGRLQEQLPAMSTVFQVNHDELVQRLAEIPDEINEVLKLFDGHRTLVDVVDASLGDDLATMNAITKLYFEGFIVMADAPEEGLGPDAELMVGESGSTPVSEEALAPMAEEGAAATREAEADAMVALTELTPPLHEQELSPAAVPDPIEPGSPEGRVALTPEQPLEQASEPESPPPAEPSRQSESALPEPPSKGETSSTLPEPPSKGETTALDAGGDQSRGSRSPTQASSATPGEAKAVQAARVRGGDPPPISSMKTEASSTDPLQGSSGGALEEYGEMGKRSRRKAKRSRHQPQSVSEVAPRPESNVIRFPSTGGTRAGDAGGGASAEGAAIASAVENEPAVHEPQSSAPTADGDAQASGAADSMSDGEAARPNRVEAEPARAQQAEPARAQQSGGAEPDVHPEDAFLRASEPSPEMDAVETFFSSDPPPPEPAEQWLDMSRTHVHDDPGSHRARRWTLRIALGAIVLIGGFVLYNKVWMPTPETLGQGTVALPTPQLATGAKARVEEAVPPVAQADAPEGAQEAVKAVEAPPEMAAGAADEAEAPGAQEEADEAQAAEDAEPSPGPAIPDESAAELYDKLVAKARKLRFRKGAYELFMRALAVKPDGHEALGGLAMVMLNRGKNKRALERASQAVALDETNSEAWIVLGAARGATGDPKGAREAYRRCVQKGEGRYVRECRRMLH